jgi:hypothetical protein
MKMKREQASKTIAGLVVVAGMMWAGAGCSSNSTSTEQLAVSTTAQPAASTTAPAEPEVDPSVLTAEQRAALQEAATAYDAAEQLLVERFDSVTVVPELERWHESELAHQEALVELREALPDGACRASIDTLLVVEDGQNEIRLRLIEHYRQDEFALVADDTVDYFISVVDGALPAEEEVAVACGRSSVDSSRTSADAGTLTPDQNALLDAVLAAYAATGVAYGAAFSVSEFVTVVQAVQDAEAAAAEALDEVLAVLGDGECRTALDEVRAIEQTQAELRDALISAGEKGDLLTLFRTLGDYTEVNSSSEPFVTARQAAVDACGEEL